MKHGVFAAIEIVKSHHRRSAAAGPNSLSRNPHLSNEFLPLSAAFVLPAVMLSVYFKIISDKRKTAEQGINFDFRFRKILKAVAANNDTVFLSFKFCPKKNLSVGIFKYGFVFGVCASVGNIPINDAKASGCEKESGTTEFPPSKRERGGARCSPN